MKTTIQKHFAAIKSGRVSKTNVIGLRKAINADCRRSQGHSTGCTSPKATHFEVCEIDPLLEEYSPRIIGQLHETGKAVLRNPRYRKRWTPYQREVIDSLRCFRLTGFMYQDMRATPIYEAVSSTGESFRFINVPWQSGGRGPEVV